MSKRQYNAADFQRYYNGTMPVAERHALEKEALEDVFLADALEGFSFSANFQTEKVKLNKRLNARLEKDKKSHFFIATISENWLRIAALFVLLAGAGWGILKLFPTDSNSELAVEKPIKKGVTQPIETTAAAQDSVNSVAVAPSSIEKEPKQKPAKKGIEEDTNQMRKAIENDAQDDVAQLNSQASASLLNDTSDVASLQVFSGKVVDATGNPLPLATVKAKNATTATDLTGRFKIAAPDSPLTATVSANGFEANRLQLGAPAQNTVVLKESAALSKLTEATGEQSKKALKRGTTGLNAAVNGGLESFNVYVAQNKKLDPKTTTEFGGKSVLLIFDVDSDGTPTNIKVDQPLCAACDAEAVRLLQKGPKWSTGKGQVVITF